MDRNSGLARVEGTQLFPPIESIVRCCCITILKSPVKGFSTYLCFLVHPSIELSPAHPSQLLLLHPHPHYTRRCCCDCWIVEKETLLVGIKPPAICPSPPPPVCLLFAAATKKTAAWDLSLGSLAHNGKLPRKGSERASSLVAAVKSGETNQHSCTGLHTLVRDHTIDVSWVVKQLLTPTCPALE